MTSDWAIDQHNELMATDEEYAAGYAESQMFDQWQEYEFFKKQAEEEIFENFFDDYRIAFDGYEEQDERTEILSGDDLPF